MAKVSLRQRRPHPRAGRLTSYGLGDHSRAGAIGRRRRPVRGPPRTNRQNPRGVRFDRSRRIAPLVGGIHGARLPCGALGGNRGGQGGTLADMACVIEAAAAGLLPGPLLSTAAASAVADSADVSGTPLMTDLAAGATAVVVLPEHSDVLAVAKGGGWRLTGSTGSTLGLCAAQYILLAARSGDGAELWFVLDTPSKGSGLTIEQQRGTDLCTDVGVRTSLTIPCQRTRCCPISPPSGRDAPWSPSRHARRPDGAPMRASCDGLHPHS